jgi:hypothetical protein
MIQTSDPDPSMYGALPPGAWWEVANGAEPVFEPYADKAGEAAVTAARQGDLELVNVSFSYPVRKEMAGEQGCESSSTPMRKQAEAPDPCVQGCARMQGCRQTYRGVDCLVAGQAGKARWRSAAI